MEIVPSEDLHDVPVAKRKCKFDDETEDLEIFSKYSQSTCEMECKIKQTASVCKCYPWFIPRPMKSSNPTICGIYGNYCFKSVMNSNDVEKNCKCLPTCHQVEFTYNEQLDRLDHKALCYERQDSIETSIEGVETLIAKNLMENGHNSLAYKYFKVKEFIEKSSNETLDSWEYQSNRVKLCQYLVKNHLAKVSVMFDRKKYVRTLTNLKVTFADKLSTFGEYILKTNLEYVSLCIIM